MIDEIAQTCSPGCGPQIDLFPILIVVALWVGYSYWSDKIKKRVKVKVEMKNIKNIGIVAAVVVAAVAIVLAKQFRKTESVNAVAPIAATAETSEAFVGDGAAAIAEAALEKALPKLVDLGASKCIPCKKMKPILDDLMANYADRFTTEFIDVWEDPDSGHQYGVESIPTQIFFGADGKELFRHEGFFSKEDILAKWKELGVE